MAAKAANGLWPDSATRSADATKESTAAAAIRPAIPSAKRSRDGQMYASQEFCARGAVSVMRPAPTSKTDLADIRPLAVRHSGETAISHHGDSVRDLQHLLELRGEIENRRAGL